MRNEELFQALPVDRVDGRPRAFAAVDLVHGRAIDGLPLVEKPNAVERGRLPLGERAQLAEHGAPPVDDRTVGIEGERPNHRLTGARDVRETEASGTSGGVR